MGNALKISKPLRSQKSANLSHQSTGSVFPTINLSILNVCSGFASLADIICFIASRVSDSLLRDASVKVWVVPVAPAVVGWCVILANNACGLIVMSGSSKIYSSIS